MFRPLSQTLPRAVVVALIALCLAVNAIQVAAGDPQMANGNASQAHHSCTLGHVINNSYRLGQKVPFNAKAGRFGDNADAYEHFMKLHALMRDGVGVPEDKAEYIVGPWLTFDAQTERFTGEFAAEANKLVQDPHRAGFKVPSVDKV